MNTEEKKSPEYLEGFFDGTQKMREIFEKCADDADKLNYDKGYHDALATVMQEVRKIYAENTGKDGERESGRCGTCIKIMNFIEEQSK